MAVVSSVVNLFVYSRQRRFHSFINNDLQLRKYLSKFMLLPSLIVLRSWNFLFLNTVLVSTKKTFNILKRSL